MKAKLLWHAPLPSDIAKRGAAHHRTPAPRKLRLSHRFTNDAQLRGEAIGPASEPSPSSTCHRFGKLDQCQSSASKTKVARKALHSTSSVESTTTPDSFVHPARETPGARYADWRPPLLDFCLREVLMPEQVAAALEDQADFQLGAEVHLSQAALADLPLICVCHACRLFWA